MDLILQCIGLRYSEAFLTREATLRGDPIHLIFLGPTQTGKTKLLSNFGDSDESRSFPSEVSVREQAVCSIVHLGPEVQMFLYATSDSTVNTLLTSYLNDCSVVVLTYSIAELSHLRLLKEKYVPLLRTHRQHRLLTIFIVGTRAKNNPYIPLRKASLLQELTRILTLNLVVYAFRSEVEARVGTLEVTVDDFDSVKQLKETIVSFILSA